MVSLLLLLETCDLAIIKTADINSRGKGDQKLHPRGHLKAMKLRSHFLAAESREKLGTDNKPENAL